MSFSGDIGRFAFKSTAKLQKTQRLIAVKLFTLVVKRTPVDTGRLIANWIVSKNVINKSTNKNNDKSGRIVVENIIKTIDGKEKKVYLTNSLPYAIPIEYGHSQKRPEGMVRTSIADIKRIVKESVSQA